MGDRQQRPHRVRRPPRRADALPCERPPSRMAPRSGRRPRLSRRGPTGRHGSRCGISVPVAADPPRRRPGDVSPHRQGGVARPAALPGGMVRARHLRRGEPAAAAGIPDRDLARDLRSRWCRPRRRSRRSGHVRAGLAGDAGGLAGLCRAVFSPDRPDPRRRGAGPPRPGRRRSRRPRRHAGPGGPAARPDPRGGPGFRRAALSPLRLPRLAERPAAVERRGGAPGVERDQPRRQLLPGGGQAPPRSGPPGARARALVERPFPPARRPLDAQFQPADAGQPALGLRGADRAWAAAWPPRGGCDARARRWTRSPSTPRRPPPTPGERGNRSRTAAATRSP